VHYSHHKEHEKDHEGHNLCKIITSWHFYDGSGLVSPAGATSHDKRAIDFLCPCLNLLKQIKGIVFERTLTYFGESWWPWRSRENINLNIWRNGISVRLCRRTIIRAEWWFRMTDCGKGKKDEEWSCLQQLCLNLFYVIHIKVYSNLLT